MLPRTLVVGLGGTGALAVLTLKQLFADSGSLGPLPPNVRLLAIDTASPERLGDLGFEEQEFFRLSLPDPAAYLASSASAHVHQWFPDRALTGQMVLHGAAQIRPLGRLALFAQVEALVARLKSRLDDLTERARLREASSTGYIDDHGAIEIYLVASVCGGTGGALFLDVAALLRDALKNAHVQVFGVFMLPGPFRGRPGTARVLPNAYATLKELDHLAGLNHRTPLVLDYGSRQIELRASPFDLVYLVDSIGETYDTTSSVGQLARQMAYLMLLMSSSDVGTKVRAIFSNSLSHHVTSPPVLGKRPLYASFGIATIETPAHAVREARRDLQVALFDTLVSARVSVATTADFAREARERLVAPGVGGWPELALHDDPRAASLAELEMAYHDRRADAIDHARETAERVTAEAVSPLREHIRRMAADAATRVGGLSAIRDASHVVGDLLFSIRQALPGPQENTARLAEAEREQQVLWSGCQKAFAAFSRRRRAPAVQRWQAWVNDEVLPVLAEATANDVLRSAIGALRDEALALENWCVTALAAMTSARDDRAATRIVVEPSPSPFSRYIDSQQIRIVPDSARFLRQADLTAIVSAGRSHAACVEMLVTESERFAADTFREAIEISGHASPTRLLAANGRHTSEELQRFSSPLWNCRRTPVEPQTISILGIDQRSLSVVPSHPRAAIAQTPWWDRVVQLQIRTGTPLFALTCMQDLWRAYSGIAHRGEYHLDRRWSAWPEVLSHDFPRPVLESFAHAIALGLIDVSTPTLHYKDGTGSRDIGRTFSEAFETLGRERRLLEEIQALASHSPVSADTGRRRDELAHLLACERIVTGDRPLVEALHNRLDLWVDAAAWR